MRRGFTAGLFAIADAINRLADAVERHNMRQTQPVDLYGPRGTEIRGPAGPRVTGPGPTWDIPMGRYPNPQDVE